LFQREVDLLNKKMELLTQENKRLSAAQQSLEMCGFRMNAGTPVAASLTVTTAVHPLYGTRSSYTPHVTPSTAKQHNDWFFDR
jgi:hypothetical protein